MGWSFSHRKAVKETGKDHQCAFCERIIPKGSTNISNWYGKWNGKLLNLYGCDWCIENEDKLTNEISLEILDFWDCLYENIFRDKVQELRQTGNCIVIDFDKEDQDYLTFIDDVTGKVVHREFMPVVNK